MYLIHVRLRPTTPGSSLPPGLRSHLLGMSVPEDRIEHLSVHTDALPHPTLGLYLMAESLGEAEEQATRLCLRWVTGSTLLEGWQPVAAQAPLVAPFYEQLLSFVGSGGPR
ncbi:hypothetical protein GCM10010193_42980 [Kitasatospora atroaurantiaca]|uniref:Uncharacterized protein n=1 Tax=Kitasatospora atroaurantiaca TaxID=285545 RepID=A0A561ETU2_9ACTN|nr:hypothetical protein [Kitasatospora atroaurantiaca]TWE19032.1 hypothetical protein FB465_4134 [Kitasatospora atroaurantiaca]